MDVKPPFGQWLKQQRRHFDLTQADLARRLGYSTITIRKIEAGDMQPSKQFIELLAGALGIGDAERAALLASVADGGDIPAAFVPSSVPTPATPLIGRDGDLRAVSLLLREPSAPRLVTLVGPPGVGKTRLAIEVARAVVDDFQHGVWWVDLAPITDPQAALAAIAQVVGARDRPGQPVLRVLQDHLRGRRLALVLDNLEQVLDAAPSIARLLGAAPGVKALATSRERLRITGEQIYEVAPLADEAVTLFAQRAQAAQPGFALTGANRETVATICRKLDGLPLAIELAAARVPLFTLDELLTRLDQRLALLTDGARDLPPRQRALRATLDWSHALLTPDEQVLFCRLGVFASPPTLDAIEAVCCDGDTAPSLITNLSGLVWKSLVQPAARAGGASRYRLLETIREYAMSKLTASGESEFRHRKVGEHLLTLTTDLRITHPDDADNWRAALKWAINGTQSTRLAMDLADVWGPFAISPREAEGWLQQLHDRAAALGDEALRIEVLMNLGTILNVRGDSARARRIFETTLASPHVRKLRLGVLGSHFMLGLIAREAGDIQTSRAHFEYCVQNCPLEAPDYMHWLYSTMAETEIAAEDGDAALRLLAKCDHFEPHHPNGATFLQAWLLIHRARALMLQGDLAAAREHLDHSLTVYAADATDGDSLMASTRQSLGEIALSAGDPAEARDQLQLSLSEHDRRGDAAGIAWCLAGLAGAAALDEKPERAAILWGAGEALRERIERRIAPASRRNREHTLAMLRAQLGEAEFARLAAEGAKMPVDEAVAFALAES